ncbi:MAG: MazG nucleotide pyrophosphohydrolase domain-containing protein [Candidatus Gracilibacteria bacterium]|nr:MazG nucleotide pyrophosphohydrolase domain-containing protein [Candidatus Gracilibacteria bacterium]
MLLTLEKIIELSEKKVAYLNQSKQNSEVIGKYIKRLREQVEQAEKNISDNNDAEQLEKLLGDILWSYFCLVDSLEADEKTTREEILHKAYKKHKYEKDIGINEDEEVKQQETKSKVSAYLGNLLKKNNK